MASEMVETAAVRAEVFRNISHEVERARMTIDFEADDEWINGGHVRRLTRRDLPRAKSQHVRLTRLAARSFRLCVIAVANAMHVNQTSLARADVIEKIHSRIE